MRSVILSACAAGLTAVAACNADPPAPPAHADAQEPAREPFPGIRIDRDKKTVEFDGAVPIDVRNKDGAPIFLELIACSPDTREHESLVVVDATPSQIHAALLLIGLKPGKPGAWRAAAAGGKGDYDQPEGDRVRVEFILERDGQKTVEPAESWVVRDRTGDPLPLPGAGFVFAGSRFVTRQGKEWYDADGAGAVIGLCTFGSEMIAYPKTISPEANLEEPVWVADPKKTPPSGTRVTVRLSPVAEKP